MQQVQEEAVAAVVRGVDLVTSILALSDLDVRVAYVRDRVLCDDPAMLAEELDALVRRVEEFDPRARVALASILDTMNDPRVAGRVQRLREEAAGRNLEALDRFLYQPVEVGSARSQDQSSKPQSRGPEQTKATLGARKSLARRATLDSIERLLSDPHPDVTQRLLSNPRMTEELVLRVATARGTPSSCLAAIARTPRWSSRSHVRLALVLNPALPEEVATRLSFLLLRQELLLVAERSPEGSRLRELCRLRLSRSPPRRAG